MRLGIDFGTTRTVVATAEGGNYPVCSFSSGDTFEEYIPSLVGIKDKQLCFGWDTRPLQRDPGFGLLRSMKRQIGQLRPDDLIDLAPVESLPVLEVLTRFLLHLKKMILQKSNLVADARRPLEAMVGVPANANSNQRWITMEAFRRAGFKVLGLMNEPTAAAVEFTHRYLQNLGPRSPKQYVVVYDLGGGTFDTAAVGLAERNYEVIAHEGIARLGGDDFDELILAQALKELADSAGELNRNQKEWLLEECRERKEGLKPNTQKTMIDLEPLLGAKRTIILEARDIYAACDDLVNRTLDAVGDVIQQLRDTGISPDDSRSFAALYLVGGSVAFPPVARKLRHIYGRKVVVSPYPHAATAIGLAIAADPAAQVGVTETVSRSFGVWRENAGGRDKVFDQIFQRQIQLDPQTGEARVVRAYRPVHNIGHLRYLECGALGYGGEPRGDIRLLKDVYFPYDPGLSNRKGLSRVPITERPELADQEVVEIYVYGRDGIIRVEIENRSGGYCRKYTLGAESRSAEPS